MRKVENTIDEIYMLLKDLPEERIREVKEFIKSLKEGEAKQKEERSNIISLMGSINPEDIEIMRLAIEEDCERIEINGW